MQNPDPELGPNKERIDELLGSLKRLAPPLESRVANREAVAGELALIAQRRQTRAVPFWRRTVAVPWPVVAAVIAVLVALSILPFRSGLAPEMTHEEPTDERQRWEQLAEKRTSAVLKTSNVAYYESNIYLCGIGPLHSEMRCLPEENNDERTDY